MALEVAGKTAVAADPSDGALDDPAFRQHDEFVFVAAADNLGLPLASVGNGSRHLRPWIARVTDDPLYEGEHAVRLGGLPPRFAGRIIVATNAHSASVRSEG
jgi:hypothetical protein